MEISGESYRINTDFRAGIAYWSALIAEEPIRRDALLGLFFPDGAPPDPDAAVAAISDFLRCGDPAPTAKEDENGKPPPYSFLTDGVALTAEFQRVYGIDLTSAELHWWRFSALLRGLLSHSFSERVKFRLCDLNQIKNKETRSQYSRLKELYALGIDGKPIRRPKTLEEYNEMLLAQARGERW